MIAGPEYVLGVDDDVVVAFRLTAAEEGIALFRLTRVTVRILDFAGENRLLTGCAVAHPATEVEIQVIFLAQFEDAFLVASPFAFNIGFFEDDFSHRRAG